MFVQTNSVRAVKEYFKSRLADLFSENEIRTIAKSSIMQRLNLSNADYLLSDAQLVSESDLLFFRSIVKRLQKHEPFQYIVGVTTFFDLDLKTDKRALIPRPETEELVNLVLEDFKNDQAYKIMDLCTGSGCIALAIKSVLSKSELFGLDYSSEAISLAQENSQATGLACEWLTDDALNLSNANFSKNSFDCWVSNPPYIPHSDKVEMKANVLEYEPGMALFVEDADPLLFYRRIAEQGREYLKVGGRLYFEIHERYGKEMISLLEGLGYENVEVVKDLQGKDRMVSATN